ncbi:MAG: hypothetical protein RSB77_02800 [Bacilli bacterium]
MASRMEKFHNETNAGKRVVKNQELYKHIYENEKYTNIEGVLETDLNTVNIYKLKDTIDKHEKQTSEKKQLVKRDVELDMSNSSEMEEEDNHDLNELLNKAKEEKEEDEIDKYRSLKIEEFTVLKKIKDKNKKFNKKEKDKEIKEELMNTMQLSKEELESLEDQELCIDLFSDLQNNSIGGESEKSINDLINEAKEENEEDTENLDGCFNTQSMKLSKKDFDDTIALEKIKIEKKRKLPKILGIIFLILLIILGIIYVLFYIFK